MDNNFKDLWLLRGYPSEKKRIDEFIEEGIIAIGWNELGDMKGKDSKSIASELRQTGHSITNVVIGVINYFVNNMKVGDICLIPADNNKIYIAKIESDYFYEETKIKAGYPHQRKATFLNINDPINRYDLPEDLQKSLRAQNTVANLTHRKEVFCNFMNNGQSGEDDSFDIDTKLKNELTGMMSKALENLKNDLECDDPARRAAASVEVIKLIQNLK